MTSTETGQRVWEFGPKLPNLPKLFLCKINRLHFTNISLGFVSPKLIWGIIIQFFQGFMSPPKFGG